MTIKAKSKFYKLIRVITLVVLVLFIFPLSFFFYQEYTYYELTKKSIGHCHSETDTLKAKRIGSYISEYKCINDLDLDISYAYLEHPYYPSESYFNRYKIHYNSYTLQVISEEEFPKWHESEELGTHYIGGVFSKNFSFEDQLPDDTLVFNVYRNHLTKKLDTVRFVRVN